MLELFNHLKTNAEIARPESEMETHHNNRLESINQHKMSASIIGELEEYFFNKYVIPTNTDINLQDIIEKINSDEILSKDFQFNAILEDIKACEANVNSKKLSEIFSNLTLYQVNFTKNI